jgi:hypothetical protein
MDIGEDWLMEQSPAVVCAEEGCMEHLTWRGTVWVDDRGSATGQNHSSVPVHTHRAANDG